MQYKEDVDQAKKRIEAWLHGEIIDRAVIAVTAPLAGAQAKPFEFADDLATQWVDADYVVAKHQNLVETTFYGGEAIPRLFVNLGPGSLAAMMSGNAVLATDTVWFPKSVESLDEILSLEIDRSNKWYRAVESITTESARAGKDKWMTSVSDIGGAADVIASLRGTSELLLDIGEDPDSVVPVRDHVASLWIELYDELYAITQDGQEGSASWLLSYAPGTHYPLQNDFSAMISPRTFSDLFLPGIRRLAQHLDHVLYHLDGPDAVCHLDALIEMPELEVIQWVPGWGAPPMPEWIDLLDRIQKGGKSIHISVDPEEVETLMQHLSPKGLFMDTSCACEAQAKDLIKRVERLT